MPELVRNFDFFKSVLNGREDTVETRNPRPIVFVFKPGSYEELRTNAVTYVM
jgi:hypothetical protein